ncbi:efflux RND transporter periplasmic adaptor subunit [Sphingomonas sp. DG1-23]|uniref:efflux RND transporter periplasmic adaptor subunit n=1 Tax=Sphingomonas sp. DG1-23 TaxID=3068316 RepID=UPI00273E2E53|nr:efflux RND transporter periplasmic adaptor subunit [Sphingomonas sp. DG1-23]MDP5279880.1 efflux RND transporter periplasmic adaptor subunit [Sphingomonas sp. DG1-23]
MTATVADRLRELRLDREPTRAIPRAAPAVRTDRDGGRRSLLPLLLTGMASLAVGSVATASLLGSAGGKPEPVAAAPVPPASPIAEAPAASLVAAGFVVPQRGGTVGSQVTGQLRQVLVAEGDHVQAGQIIARVDDSDARAALDRAIAAQAEARETVAALRHQHRQAVATLARRQALSQRGFTTMAALEESQAESGMLGARIAAAEAASSGATAAVRAAHVMLDRYAIRAPFAGVVIEKNAEVGELVSPISAGGGFTRTGVVTLVDMASLQVEADVNEAYISGIRSGQRVALTFDALPGERFEAAVAAIVPSADRNRATVRVNIAFVRRDPRILPQMAAKAAFLPKGDPS